VATKQNAKFTSVARLDPVDLHERELQINISVAIATISTLLLSLAPARAEVL
jgi:hypothetical protein